MSRTTWLSLLATALAVGYLTGMVFFRHLDVLAQSPAPAVAFDFVEGKAPAQALGSGWKAPDAAGAMSTARNPTVLIDIGAAAQTDTELAFDIVTRAPPERAAEVFTVPITLNGQDAGTLSFAAIDIESRHRLLVAKQTVLGARQLELGFDLSQLVDAGKPRVAFALRRITVRDASRLAGQVGSLDGCVTAGLVGWAVGRDGPAPVIVKVNGATVPLGMKATARPDLGALGLPHDSGFSVRFRDAPRAGSRVEVMFANGQALANSPCRL